MFQRLRPLFLLAATLLSACTSTIHLRALSPAAVQIPDDLRRIATANRIVPTTTKDKFYDILEGVFTGEAPAVDRAGADECVMVLGQSLANNSPRFQVTQAQLQLLGRTREFFLPPLQPRYVKDVCRDTQVDGIVVLEAFDSDMALTHTDGVQTVRDKEGHERKVPVVHVEMVMKVVSGFRTYSAKQGMIVDQAKLEDQFVWAADGDTYQNALRGLPAPDVCIRRVAQMAGDKYARRIGPSFVTLERFWYTNAKGDQLMKDAALRAGAEDWDGAMEIWQRAAKNLNPTIAGRALFNMAVACEVKGDLPGAIEWAKKSAYSCRNGQAREYLLALNERMREAEVIKEQLRSLPY